MYIKGSKPKGVTISNYEFLDDITSKYPYSAKGTASVFLSIMKISLQLHHYTMTLYGLSTRQDMKTSMLS
jgi:hypothetical protein